MNLPTSTPHGDAARRASLKGALIAFVTALLLGVAAWVVVQVGKASQAVMEQGRVRMDNLARAFTEHTATTLQSADQVLRIVRREYTEEGAALDIAACLQRGDIIDSQYHLLTVIGADGVVLNSSQPFQRVNLRDREHFRVHAVGQGDRLFISRPVIGRVSGKASIQVTRRAVDNEGRFAGVVVVSLQPEVFTSFRRQADEARSDLLLVGYDGIVRSRLAGTDREAGQSLAGSPLMAEALEHGSGSIVARSPVDGVERLYTYRTLEPYGMVAFSGMRMELLQQEIREQQLQIVGTAVLAGVTLLGFLGLMLRTERRRQALLERLQRSERKAHSAKEMQTRFLRTISRELRTPLNGILSFSELIRDTSTDPEAREFGAIVHHSAEQLHELLSSLMDLAKLESGRTGLQPETVELGTLLHELVDMHLRSAESRGLALALYVAPDAAKTVVTDRLRLLQLLNHLVTNALKFTEHGRVRLSLTADAQGVLIRVQDSGIGMSPTQLDTLFSRVGGEATDYVHHAQGPGLGLSLARELAELLGGSLCIDSTEGEGTLAELQLPLEITAQPAGMAHTSAAPSPTTNTSLTAAPVYAAAPAATGGRVQGNLT
jgi:signal transduction histidine kinase